jgi:hypothetical protein
VIRKIYLLNKFDNVCIDHLCGKICGEFNEIGLCKWLGLGWGEILGETFVFRGDRFNLCLLMIP